MKKKFNTLRFINDKKLQKFYIRVKVLNKEFNDIPSLLKQFTKETGIKMELTRQEINNIKFQYEDKFNNLNLLELVNTIRDDNFKLEIKSYNNKYKYKYRKKIKIMMKKEKIIL